jgi:glucans biosynthesis protein
MLAMNYRMVWRGDDAAHVPAAYVAQSRRGQGYRVGKVPPDAVQFHVDFVGAALQGLGSDSGVEAVVSADDNASGLRAQAYPNPVSGGWRMTLDFRRRDAKRPVELRAFLRQGQQVLSETWSYALPPE